VLNIQRTVIWLIALAALCGLGIRAQAPAVDDIDVVRMTPIGPVCMTMLPPTPART
jgi:hypothetical protein